MIGPNFLILILLSLFKSHAFSLSDHRAITTLAFDQFMVCTQLVGHEADKKILIAGNLNEDLNLANKWSRWSHFYNPHRKLKMRRRDAVSRVSFLEKIWNKDQKKKIFLAGQMIHYIQDMASPPHVVPVMHSLNDSFEGLEVSLAALQKRSQSCQFLNTLGQDKNRNFSSLAKALAKETHHKLSIKKFEILINQKKYSMNYNAFWQEFLEGDKFGQYGLLGNNFGKEFFVIPKYGKKTAKIKKDSLIQFKLDRLEEALEFTKVALFLLYNS